MILKLGMKHQGEELYKVDINHDPGMTLTFLRQGQQGQQLSKCHLKEKTLWKWANGQKIYDSEKMDPRGRTAPTPGHYTYILP